MNVCGYLVEFIEIRKKVVIIQWGPDIEYSGTELCVNRMRSIKMNKTHYYLAATLLVLIGWNSDISFEQIPQLFDGNAFKTIKGLVGVYGIMCSQWGHLYYNNSFVKG